MLTLYAIRVGVIPASAVSAEEVAAVRASLEGRAPMQMFTAAELTPAGIMNEDSQKLDNSNAGLESLG